MPRDKQSLYKLYADFLSATTKEEKEYIYELIIELLEKMDLENPRNKKKGTNNGTKKR